MDATPLVDCLSVMLVPSYLYAPPQVHLFERRKAAAEALEAAKAAGSSVLQQLEVDRQQVEVLWNTLKKKDREGSGLVTGEQ